MIVLFAFAMGYLLGLKTDERDLEHLRRSLVALTASEEFADLVGTARTHAANVLRAWAESADPGAASDRDPDGDPLATVRDLVGQD